jgi:hypothetical protein
VGGSFRRTGYAIPLNGDGQRQLAIALPEELAGKTVRFDRLTAGGLDGLSFAVGLMPAVD